MCNQRLFSEHVDIWYQLSIHSICTFSHYDCRKCHLKKYAQQTNITSLRNSTNEHIPMSDIDVARVFSK